jgi:hypothetical protein
VNDTGDRHARAVLADVADRGAPDAAAARRG